MRSANTCWILSDVVWERDYSRYNLISSLPHLKLHNDDPFMRKYVCCIIISNHISRVSLYHDTNVVLHIYALYIRCVAVYVYYVVTQWYK